MSHVTDFQGPYPHLRRVHLDPLPLFSHLTPFPLGSQTLFSRRSPKLDYNDTLNNFYKYCNTFPIFLLSHVIMVHTRVLFLKCNLDFAYGWPIIYVHRNVIKGKQNKQCSD